MSTSDLYVINKSSVTHFAEFRNGWGSAPIAWDYLGKKYLGRQPEFSLDGLQTVWDLDKGSKLKQYERVVLRITFDGSYIPLDKLSEASAACEQFGRDSVDATRVNHWDAIGSALRMASRRNFSRYARGLCLSCTSVSDPWIGADKDFLSKAWSIYDTEMA